MAGSNINASDEHIRRLENELREKQTFANEIIHRAQNAERDLSDDERELINETRGRVEQIKSQLETVEDFSRATYETMNRCKQVDQAVRSYQGQAVAGPVEYRSAGAWALDMYGSALGQREAKDRLELFERSASHQKTTDNLGVIPDPIVGPVVDFIDAARPVVSLLGTRPLNNATFYRPVVTQHTAVAAQGSAGAAADEKSELTSQKMTIARVTGTAATYGGYVNVSRQNIDFSSPQTLDLIINDLAAQYAIETESATCEVIDSTNTAAVSYDATSQDSVAAAIWSAASSAYTATKGQGRLAIGVAPDVLATFGPLFAPYGPYNQQGTGFLAAGFGQGPMGTISGIPVYMSAGFTTGDAFLFSTAAVEVYEQRVGTLQVTEPSVMGVQVAYAGYFSALKILAAGIIPLEPGS